jgi:hypothetical protein
MYFRLGQTTRHNAQSETPWPSESRRRLPAQPDRIQFGPHPTVEVCASGKTYTDSPKINSTSKGRASNFPSFAAIGLSEIPLVSTAAADRQGQLRWDRASRHPNEPAHADLQSARRFLGRISPEKRPDRAIHIAQTRGTRLEIAAKVDKADEAYFRERSHRC